MRHAIVSFPPRPSHTSVWLSTRATTTTTRMSFGCTAREREEDKSSQPFRYNNDVRKRTSSIVDRLYNNNNHITTFSRGLSTTTQQGQGQQPQHHLVQYWTKVAPGLVMAACTMQVGFTAAYGLGMTLLQLQGVTTATQSPVSGIPVSIILGIGLHQLIPKHIMENLKPGLTMASKQVLQLGIVCVGIKLSLHDLATAGALGIPAVALGVGVGMTFVPWFGKKMGLSDKMSTLIAAGTSICGVTAITAVAPTIKANEQEMSFAIANVVCFGTAGMLVYPYLAHTLLVNPQQIGVFLGLAVHDTSQVIGSALTYVSVYGDPQVLNTAAVTKLTRNLCLAGVVPYFAMQFATQQQQNTSAPISIMASLKKYTPVFVLGFVGASIVRTLGDASVASELCHHRAFGMLSSSDWISLHKTLGDVIGSKLLLGTAMAAVGLGTNLASLRGVGAKPFFVGFVGAGVVASTGFGSALVMGHFL